MSRKQKTMGKCKNEAPQNKQTNKQTNKTKHKNKKCTLYTDGKKVAKGLF